MGTCCSKRDRRSDSAVHASVLHPSLENWKIHNRPPPLSELDAAGNGVDRIPVMWAKPIIKPPLGFPSIHYNVNSNLLCESNHSSSRSLGTHVKPQPHLSLNTTTKVSDDECLLGLANHHISSHRMGFSASAHHSSPNHEPDNEAAPAFSFATQPYIEPDFLNNTAFAFHPATQSPRLSGVNIDSRDGIQLQVRHKHMFPEEFQALQASLVCSIPPHQEPSMKRSRSDGKLPGANQEEGQHMQHHRRSFHETTTVLDVRDQTKGSMTEISKASTLMGGESLSESIAQTFMMTDMDDDYTDEEDDDNFHDINVGVSSDCARMYRTHSNDEQAQEGYLEDIKHCISLQVSLDSMNFSTDDIRKDDSASRTPNVARILDDEEGFTSPGPDDFEFKQSACRISQDKMQFMWDKDYEWQKGSEAIQGDHEKDTGQMKQQLSVVSTGDAILFSGLNSDEFHLIPSRYIPQPHSPSSPTSPRVHLSPLKLPDTYSQGLQDNTCLSVDDIMLLLESDDINEDELLSLLINTKSSPSQSPSPSSSMSMSSTSSMLTLSSTSSLSSSLSSSSPSSPRPWFPCPSTASAGASSQSLLPSMPLLAPFSTRKPSSPYSLSQRPSSRRISLHSSFEFKVKSCNSAVSTPMFSPIRSTSKRNIAHLKPTALTMEEIAEIWGVFEQRQTLMTQH